MRNIPPMSSKEFVKLLAKLILELTKQEKTELVENFHRFNRLKHSTVNPKAFPEKEIE
jgi:hypothetical protein